MSIYIHKSHNVNLLIYHLVCPAKYRKMVFNTRVDQELKNICLEISLKYEIHFLEIGADDNHVHFLIQSVPTYSPTKIATIVKSLTAREIFARLPEVKKQLWGGNFWTSGYFISTVGKNATETTIQQYVKNQGTNSQYDRLHQDQLRIFD